MSEVVNLKSRKEKKKAEIVVSDLKIAIHVMTIALQALSFFGKYGPVAEAMSSLQTNKTLLEMNLNKYKKLCE